ncbi:Fe-S protein assembly co-chaperone HscB [Buchnera aphidicola (Aphis helianthi)]|uniref:Co-chaperone protein HscB n=1 Tax=Buchnera aphidicola (Aphis helianthi) TaxID=2315802 RepID=A0A4D6XR36_9GAMM|nr:Fe-S protein assembly co-chaperone HscB [Buchnera aphidicola]QCI17394.1 Fe-S protein assembly co-chaperone HscB [Buchnera aphidicola (Aphis helianthi)]
MDYFTLFMLPKKFRINKELLNNNFYKLQLQFHPDLFINDCESKKKWILEKSININKGYKTLKSSLNRSIYLLLLHGIEINQKKLLSDNQFSLKKYFFLYEELESLKINNNYNIIHLNDFSKKIENEIENCKNIIDCEFNNKNWNQIINTISQLLFLKKIKKNLKT